MTKLLKYFKTWQDVSSKFLLFLVAVSKKHFEAANPSRGVSKTLIVGGSEAQLRTDVLEQTPLEKFYKVIGKTLRIILKRSGVQTPMSSLVYATESVFTRFRSHNFSHFHWIFCCPKDCNETNFGINIRPTFAISSFYGIFCDKLHSLS